tara:strand:- start:658 stop:948 length:291 start_codon:yes stop_codon:yes gene_type:complete
MPCLQAIGGGIMAKVNKAYSLDLETIQLIEEYTNGGQNSRSRLVNNAIRWYISGDGQTIAELHDEIMFYKELLAERTKVPVAKRGRGVWWRRLLGF